MKYVKLFAKRIIIMPTQNFSTTFLLVLLFSFVGCQSKKIKEVSDKPNVLFICIDDLNDWTGYLGGHPDTQTPNLDKLASKSVVFSRAYCPAPACNPSRAAIMTGVRPSSSGVYVNQQPWRKSPVLKDILTIPQYFREAGYAVKGSGKTFHRLFPDPISWDEYWPAMDQQRPPDPTPLSGQINSIPNSNHFDWGPLNVSKEEMADWKVTDWVINQLKQDHEKPFFLACGLYKPHLPWHVPQAYFDKFPLDSISLPETMENDLADIPSGGKKLIRFKDHQNVRKYQEWKKAVQGYLACVNFADECLGKVIDALESSQYKDNTIIVLWSDHGWHLGEKQHWRKFALWENTTRTPFMIKAPGVSVDGAMCESPVNLLDIYPTLIELCKLRPNSKNEGKSIVPLLMNPNQPWDYPSICTYRQNNHAIRLNEWRYIQYADQSEELYQLNTDPHEWNNLANHNAYQSIKNKLKQHLPTINVAPISEHTKN